MPGTSTILTFLLGSLAFVLVPGPSVLFIVGRAMALGRRAALATAAGNCLGVTALVVTVAFGLGGIIERSVVALMILKLFGAGYLIWLGIRTYRDRGRLVVEPSDTGRDRPFRDGVVVGVSNPKAIVFFSAVLPQFVDPARAGTSTQLLVLGLVFVALASSVDAVWAFAAGSLRDWFARSPVRLRRVGGVGGLMLVGMGIGVALSTSDA